MEKAIAVRFETYGIMGVNINARRFKKWIGFQIQTALVWQS